MSLKISIVGYGKMGQTLETCAREKGVNIVSIIDPSNSKADYKEISAQSVKDADVCICFTVPDVAIDNIITLSRLNKHIVMATTGWLDQMDQAKKIILENGNGMIYSSNFSLGVNLYFKVLEPVLDIFNRFDDYDVMGWEMHHKRKADAPSGTAKTIESIILKHFKRKTSVIEDKPTGRIPDSAFHYASIRGGDISGTHAVRFDSQFDSVELTHTAKNRDGFAYGALTAAKWIKDKKGIFTETDLINAYLQHITTP